MACTPVLDTAHRQATRRVGLMVMGFFAAAIAALAFAAPNAEALSTGRFAGDSRYDTMQAISSKTFNTAATVIVATGENFPDALAASSLAGAYNAPILLTDPKTLSAQASSEITRLGATKAIIVAAPGRYRKMSRTS